MNRHGLIALGLGVTCIVLTTLVLIAVPGPTPPQWGVEIGDEFTVEVQVSGINRVDYDFFQPIPFEHLNGTQLNVEIVSLPTAMTYQSGETFNNSVISSLKTTLKLENGTEVDEDLNRLISCCILPLGIWGTIDSFYVDTVSDPNMCDTFFSYLESSSLVLGHRRYFYDEGSGWDGNISIESGFPHSVRMWKEEFCEGLYRDYEIRLVLVA